MDRPLFQPFRSTMIDRPLFHVHKGSGCGASTFFPNLTDVLAETLTPADHSQDTNKKFIS
jgi:hypothetical protein